MEILQEGDDEDDEGPPEAQGATEDHASTKGFEAEASSSDDEPEDNTALKAAALGLAAAAVAGGTAGAVAAARTPNPQMKSSGSQFYIVENPQGTPGLDGQYTVYGQAISGFDVIHKIAEVEKGQNDRPVENVEMMVETKVLSVDEIKKIYNSNTVAQ